MKTAAPDQFSQRLGEKIMVLRKSRNRTQEDIAKILGISQSGYSRIETGETEISVRQLLRLSNFMEVPATSLMPTVIFMEKGA